MVSICPIHWDASEISMQRGGLVTIASCCIRMLVVGRILDQTVERLLRSGCCVWNLSLYPPPYP